MDPPEILLVYDRECPVCDAYCRLVRIRQDVGELTIVNARNSSEVINEITAHGLDIDQGMVLKMGEQLYYGVDAIHALALISTRSGVFNRCNYWLFRSKILSAMLYPLFRSFRNLLLKLLGKTRVNNLGVSGNEKF